MVLGVILMGGWYVLVIVMFLFLFNEKYLFYNLNFEEFMISKVKILGKGW